MRDPRVDAYIAKSADFAKPILRRVRELVHAACPDVQESIKWGMPSFGYHGILVQMAAFKAHCSVGFWKGSSIFGDEPIAQKREGMGSLGKLQSVADLPSDTEFTRYVKRAMKYNLEHEDSPIKVVRKKKPALPVPSYLAAALSKNKKARAGFDGLAPSKRHEYIEWLEEAKTDETRAKRMKQMLEWAAEGKGRNWAYEARQKAAKRIAAK